MAMLAGIGFTVSLLIGELAFGSSSERDEHVKFGVLVGSLVAVLLASDEATYITGTEIDIDGGLLAGSAASPG